MRWPALQDPRSYFDTGKNSRRLDSTEAGQSAALMQVDPSPGEGTAALLCRLEKLNSSPLSPGFDGQTAELVLGEGMDAAASTSGAHADSLDGNLGDPATDLPKALLVCHTHIEWPSRNLSRSCQTKKQCMARLPDCQPACL